MRLLLLVLCISVNIAFASDTATHQTTTLPPGARYEIVQSPLAAKFTFRLDRYTGQVYQLVKTQDGDLTWQVMLIEEQYDVPNPNRPRFVIFSSGLAVRYTFLMDSDTGQTWVLESGVYVSALWKKLN